jgi:hypothetical protein
MYTTRALALALADYAAAHDGHFPTGNSSTEVFQKLLDEGFVNDPSIFVGGYPRLDKVTSMDSKQKLKPENVGFDLTTPVDASSPDHLPVVFLTGYKIVYSPGADAVPLSSRVAARIPCRAVGYKDGSATYYAIDSFRLPSRGWSDPNARNPYATGARSDGVINDFIPDDFDSRGVVYRQLTPTGALP